MAMPANEGARKSIQNALLALMKKKSFQKISITEIIQYAHVSRTTYYYHYYTQKEIFDEILDDFFSRLGAYVSSGHTDLSHQEKMRQHSKHIFDFMYENRKMLKTILTSEMEHEFKMKYHDFIESQAISIFTNSSRSKTVHDSSFEYFFSGHYYLISQWILTDCTTSYDDILATIDQISRLFIM